ncbi:hypothetical protein QQA06_10585 [Acinetobacter baumannii]|uniref:hypothetical protein n=1 Tax=Acinetobacter baumannii TaxID=470 RepID=UPI001FBBCEC9|nr:hypothetical protein [Acinetobacter baumannii]MDV5202162.1 hypothetical protein [Acinetobacter baumannii]MDV5210651.1 hypothetical protein [Acinetobacter baumannii]MDV5273932.1 hypothetical protein [Acinetobacter baumannii]WPQ53784.1 hypothetical protein SLQ83_06355 [Acinetobacter baumannii]
MTDLNKLRSEFEAVTDIYHCIYNADLDYYFSGSKFASDKAEIEVNAGWKSWKKAKAQAVPEKKIYLTCEQLYAAANFGAPNKDPELLETELTIAWFEEAHSGSGYYVYISEYPEEGAMKLETESGAEG